MRSSSVWVTVALGGALAVACTPGRPDGAYDPMEAERSDRAESVGRLNGDAGMPDIPMPDSDPDEGTDAGGTQVATDSPVARLKGRYLMRVDYYSQGKKTDAATQTSLVINNRLSNLFVTDLYVQDGKLYGKETLCHQAIATECVSACTSWTWTPDANLVKQIQKVPAVTREYVLGDDGTLTVGPGTLALGFDESDAIDDPVPADPSDSRVWNLVPGTSTSGSVHVGVHFLVDATLVSKPPLTITQRLSCDVSTVQRVTTEFAGKVDLSDDHPMTGDIPFLVTASSDGATIFAQATSADQSGACTKDKLDQTRAEQDNKTVASVRFKAFNEGVNCPMAIDDFDALFQPLASAPTTFR